MTFSTPTQTIDGRLVGPARRPLQMLAEQDIGGQTSVHDGAQAVGLGLTGAPIEGPTHFSQFDPLCVEVFGAEWFTRGCISAHFQNMVVEGDEVIAQLSGIDTSAASARIDAAKGDGTPVLTGTVTLGDGVATELDERRARLAERPVGDLFIIDQIAADHVGVAQQPVGVTVDLDTRNGPLYPFSLTEKLDAITERSPWFDQESPWGGPVLPTEMLSVLAFQRTPPLPIRRPSIGLFIDLEVRYVDGPVFVDRRYEVTHTVLQVGQSRAVESWWTEAVVRDADSGAHAATVLLHQGVFKASYPEYPTAPAS